MNHFRLQMGPCEPLGDHEHHMETTIEHAVFEASKTLVGSPTRPFVWSAIDLPASKTSLSLGELGQLIRSKIMLTYSKGVSDTLIDVSLLLPEHTSGDNQTDA